MFVSQVDVPDAVAVATDCVTYVSVTCCVCVAGRRPGRRRGGNGLRDDSNNSDDLVSDATRDVARDVT